MAWLAVDKDGDEFIFGDKPIDEAVEFNQFTINSTTNASEDIDNKRLNDEGLF